MSNDLLNKVVNDQGTRIEDKGGYLDAPQVATFLDYVYDATTLVKQARVERIRGDVAEITRIGVGTRLLRVATEAVDDGVNVGAAFSKISLSTTKFRLDWELSTEALEDGREGDAFEDHIVRLMTNQLGNDIEDYAINADSSVTTDPALKGFDGWSKRARAAGWVVDAANATANRALFSAALKKLPTKHKANRAGLKFFIGSNSLQDFLDSEQALALEHNQTGVVPANGSSVLGIAGTNNTRIWGQDVVEVPLFNEARAGESSGATGSHGEIWLTNPKNLILAIKREVQVYKQFVQKKDSIEYTVYLRYGTAIENGDAFVVVKNVKIA